MGQSIKEVIYSLEEFFFKFSYSLLIWVLVLYTALAVGFTEIPFFSLDFTQKISLLAIFSTMGLTLSINYSRKYIADKLRNKNEMNVYHFLQELSKSLVLDSIHVKANASKVFDAKRYIDGDQINSLYVVVFPRASYQAIRNNEFLKGENDEFSFLMSRSLLNEDKFSKAYDNYNSALDKIRSLKSGKQLIYETICNEPLCQYGAFEIQPEDFNLLKIFLDASCDLRESIHEEICLTIESIYKVDLKAVRKEKRFSKNDLEEVIKVIHDIGTQDAKAAIHNEFFELAFTINLEIEKQRINKLQNFINSELSKKQGEILIEVPAQSEVKDY